jgi:peptidyl-prolyl cis-trans isomerase C
MMKKIMVLASFCSVLLIVGCNQAADKAPTVPSPDTEAKQDQAEMDEDILLTVNEEPISKAMYALYFQDRMRSVPDAQTSPELQMNVLNELANVILAAQDAKNKGIDKRPEIAATMELLRAKLLTQTVIQEYAEKNKPSDEQIKSYYDTEYANQTSQEFKASHILVKEEAKAKSLIEELDGGADFAELAKTHSTGPTGKKGGDLGWFDAKQMVKPFAEAVSAMEKGTYSKEPVQTQFGWHVIKLVDTREAEAPSLENVRGEIVNKLQQKTLADYMEGLRSESKVVFNEKVTKKQPAAEATDATDAADATAEAKPESEGQAQDESQQKDEETPAQDEKPADAPSAEEDAKPASE